MIGLLRQFLIANSLRNTKNNNSHQNNWQFLFHGLVSLLFHLQAVGRYHSLARWHRDGILRVGYHVPGRVLSQLFLITLLLLLVQLIIQLQKIGQ